MVRSIFLVGLLFFQVYGFSQRFEVKSGNITFFSDAPIEDIEAVSTKLSSLFDKPSGKLAFSVPIREFRFDKKLMQQHFNDKYMESAKFPVATFSGDLAGYDQSLTGMQQVTARGELSIHGVRKRVEIPGTITVKPDEVIVDATFVVALKDYNIEIPQLLWQNIAEEIKVTVSVVYKRQ